MADFQQLRDQLNESRKANEDARVALLASTERLKMLQKDFAALSRQQTDDNEDYQNRRQQLEEKIRQEKTTQARNRERQAGVKQQLAGQEKLFQKFENPAKELEFHFPTQAPFLFFPYGSKRGLKRLV